MRFARNISDFIAFTQRRKGEPWHIRIVLNWEGYKVEWRCADQSLTLEPATARKLARYLRAQFQSRFRKLSPDQRRQAQEAEILTWTDAFDAKGKEALHMNRDGVRAAA